MVVLKIFHIFAANKRMKTMAYTISNTIIENPTEACIQKLKKWGEMKALRLLDIQRRWDNGEYQHNQVVNL